MLSFDNPFTQFGLVILVVLAVSTIMKLLKQPLIIAYIFAGILCGPVFLKLVSDGETMQVFSEMGIAFLLFIVGLHLSPKVIKEVGKVSLITGIGQIVFTSLAGFLISFLLGFSIVASLYIAIALTFSSTIIIMKLLSDKDALEELFGKISVGFLLVQDLIAILALIIISSLAEGGQVGETLLWVGIKSLGAIAILLPFGLYLLPKIMDFFAKSQESLFLFAISWGFGLSILFLYAGFSIEVGALVAGIMLSVSPYCNEISSKLKPLRDFFIISFFIILGSQMEFSDVQNLITPALVFSAFILIGNPLIVIILMGLLGYTKKVGFMAGLTVAQISEFSLILIALGVKSGYLSSEILSLVTIVGLITIAGSTYMIIYSDRLFNKLSGILSLFEKKNINENEIVKKNYHCVLIGCNRTGFSVMKSLRKLSKNFLVIDFNPEIIKKLKSEGVDAVYGDVDDLEFLNSLEINKSTMIVSTISDHKTNLLILKKLKKEQSSAITILMSKHVAEALELYELGVDYVVLPYFLSGQKLSKLIHEVGERKDLYEKKRQEDIEVIKELLK